MSLPPLWGHRHPPRAPDQGPQPRPSPRRTDAKAPGAGGYLNIVEQEVKRSTNSIGKQQFRKTTILFYYQQSTNIIWTYSTMSTHICHCWPTLQVHFHARVAAEGSHSAWVNCHCKRLYFSRFPYLVESLSALPSCLQKFLQFPRFFAPRYSFWRRTRIHRDPGLKIFFRRAVHVQSF